MQNTAEQEQCLDAFHSGENMRIFAYAGAGKTSTLRLMAATKCYKRGHYLAFNRAIADDARSKFGRNVECRTLHSMAFRAMAGDYTTDKLTFSLRINQINMEDRFARNLVFSCLKRFWQSSDATPEWFHVPLLPKLKMMFDSESDLKAYRTRVAIIAGSIWEEQVDLGSSLPLGHDGYLKLWALSNPHIHCDFLLVDEAQDLNPVVIGIVQRQQHAQIITCGDSWQQIYEWRGAVDALQLLPGNPCYLTRSFRFGDMIAGAADDVLRAGGEPNQLFGNPSIDDDIVVPGSCGVDAILCRTNAGVISAAIHCIGQIPVHIQGGVAELKMLVEDAQRLMARQPAQSWELTGFKDWSELEEYCKGEDAETQIKSYVNLINRYGITTLLELIANIRPNASPDAMTISTAHKSKGLEWESVEVQDFDLNTEEVALPERRLFYVAITRAKKILAISEHDLATYS